MQKAKTKYKVLALHSRVVNRAGLFGSGSGSGLFGPDTMLTNKLSKKEIILLSYIYSM